MASPTRPVSYGFDAPGIMWGMQISGAAAVLFGSTLVTLFSGWPRIVGFIAIVGGLVPLILGLSMVVYGLTGKMRMRDKIMSMVDWRGDEQVLDIGTGQGLLLIGAAKRLNLAGRATGVDIFLAKDLTNNTLDQLAANVAAEGVENRVALMEQDARKLNFADASFDVVFSLYCIHNIEDANERKGALLEAVRVLKPGGRLLIGEWMPTHGYATILKEAGLTVRSSRTYLTTAMTLMWLVDVTKPNALSVPRT